MRYDGTRATLRGKFTYGMGEIEIHDHLTNRVEQITPDVGAGHGGGDAGLVASFVKSLRSGSNDALTSARNSMESHLMAFAAEKARIEGNVISMPVYKQSFNY